MPIWARIVTALAAVRVATALVLYLSGIASPTYDRPVPAWVYAALTIVSTAVGAMLVLTNRRDARAEWLGATFVLWAVPMGPPVLADTPITAWMPHLRLDGFLPYFTWRFVTEFPSRLHGRPSPPVAAVLWVCAIAGTMLFLVNLSFAFLPLGDGDLRGYLAASSRSRGSVYWVILLGLNAAAIAALLWKARTIQGSDRGRLRLFAIGLSIGTVPAGLQILLEELIPAYNRFSHLPAVEPWIGAVIFGSVACVPVATAYSVLFDRVVDLRVALHAAAQYVLARYSIIFFTLIPFFALALLLFINREEPIVALFSGVRPVLLTAAVVLGVVCLRLREQWLVYIDRRFYREAYDARLVLTQIVEGLPASSVDELSSTLERELEHAMHAEARLFVGDESSAALRNIHSGAQSLAANSVLVGLASADSQAMDVDLAAGGGALRRLPAEERLWLEQGGFRLLIAVRRSSGTTVGLIALSAKRSGLPYSDADRRLLAAVASAAGLALDNLRLRSTPESPAEPAARECVECARLESNAVESCECGGQLVAVRVPRILRGTFRLERRIGAGGMGVVYRAIDMNLGREVAVKTLPRVTPAHVDRLRREARAMASLIHPNLAIVHGIETWQGIPFLIEEYLAGGTLRDRLAVRRCTLAETLELGATLSETLGQLHANGVIHCDIKPSNIGYTHSGVLKLLDFGLARLLHDLETSTFRTGTASLTTDQSQSSASLAGVFGTPHYMSPEAARRDSPNPGFDLWALAVLMFEALTGRRPFDGKDSAEVLLHVIAGRAPALRSVLPEAPVEMDAFLAAALSPDRDRRPHDARAFFNAVRELRSTLSLQ